MSYFKVSSKNIKELINVSKGLKKADTVILNGQLVNVLSNEMYPADVAIKNGRIAYVGDVKHTIGRDTEVINAKGRYLTPGLIETHMHVAGSQLNMTELAKVLLLKGTTAIVTDFYEIGIVAGVKGIKFCLEELNRTPLTVFYQIGAQIYLQNGDWGNTGTIKDSDLMDLLEIDECIGISEWPLSKIEEGNEVILNLIEAAINRDKIFFGHISEASIQQINAYACSGASSDHESVEASEALDKLRKGFWVMIREGTAAKDLNKLVSAIVEKSLDSRRVMFCTDEEDPSRLVENGHMDKKVRMAIQCGLNPIDAVRIATINASEYLNIAQHMGSISPGKIANVLLIEDLQNFVVDQVVANGRIVAKEGTYLDKLESPVYPDWMYNSVHLRKSLEPGEIQIKTKKGQKHVKVRVIGQKEGCLITESLTEELLVKDGIVGPDVSKDILKLVYVERHKGSGKIGKGFVKGFGLQRGAVGSTFNPECENIVALGTNDNDICFVVNRLKEIGGGFIVVENEKVIKELALPLLGLLSDKEYKIVVDDLNELNLKIYEFGCEMEGSLTQLAFICVPREIGNLKISEEGLIDVWKNEKVDIIID